MKKLIDISGLLSNEMWMFGEPFPNLDIKVVKAWKEGFGDFSFTDIRGLHALTGTYVETPAHYVGYENSFLIADLPLEKLVDIDCVVMDLKDLPKDADGRMYVRREDLENCPTGALIQEGDAILVNHGWGDTMWFDQDNFPKSPYFTYDAFMWLLEKKPSVIGSDTSCWDNLGKPEGFFGKFYEQNILMLAECVNLGKAPAKRVKLNILPLRLENTCASPCRAYLHYEE